MAPESRPDPRTDADETDEGAADDGRLGRDFRLLWGTSTVSTLGDGIYLTALLLIGASLTSDPALLSLLAVAGTLPPVLFALVSGALVDRLEHRRVMWVTDTARFLVLVVLTLLVATGNASIWLLAAASLLLSTGETLYGTAAQSIVPRIVSRAPHRLRLANSRLASAQIVVRDFIGRPLGGALYSAVGWLPVAVNAVSFGLGALLVSRIRSEDPPSPKPGPRRALFREIAEGLRWLWRHRLLRTLALAVCVDNLAFTAWSAVLVLLLEQHFRVYGAGFGALTACLGAGGIAGSLGVTRLGRRFGVGVTLIGAMLLEGVASALLGLASDWEMAAAALFVIGVCAIGWNVLTVSLRQSIVPDELQGRVNGAYRLVAGAGAPIGAAAGGLLARWLGLGAPFLVGGAAVVAAGLIVATVVRTDPEVK